MSSTSRGQFFSWLSRKRGIEIIAASCIAVILTAIITYIPKFDLVEAAMNDDNFTDIVLRTRGDLPIDTNIRVVTYDAAIFDSTDRVDRTLLTLRLAALMELKPRVAGVDFLLEDLRPEAADGDTMLASLIADHPNLIFGIFHEDSLNRFRIPPALFGSPNRFGCINLQDDDDGTIRTYTTLWGEPEKQQVESFDLRVARLADSAAAAHLDRFSQRTFVIDYAAGIGETKRSSDAGGDQVFPTIPLDTIFNIISSGDSAGTEALRDIFAGKTVLVGYGDIRKGQVTSVVDRFYTPLRQEKQGLPDMNGVGIHANILNTILAGRIVQIVPLWLNLVWGFVLVAIRLLS
ncbi:MAG: CHASE2 domain-containing protein, partial [Bacteroidota bacterium]